MRVLSHRSQLVTEAQLLTFSIWKIPALLKLQHLTNAGVAHSVIYDDMDLGPGTHIGVIIIPDALALAERKR